MEKRTKTAIDSNSETDRRDAMFEVLSDSRRRFSLQHLRGADAPITVDELTTEIAAWEAGQPVTARPGGDANAIEVALVHNHLPRMASAGLVEYDATKRTVALTDQSPQVQSHLEVIGAD